MSHSANQRERPCTIYVQQDEQNMPTSQEIQKTLETSKSIDDKIAAIKNLIISLIHDESFPPMMLTIINYVLPVQNESHNLKKVLLYYWEIAEKLDQSGQLKSETLLVCNALRNDLLHPNEYIRGRTLRLLSKLMFKGILEPLIPTVLENLKHKNSYVRRNAVSCLYIIYLNFQSDVLPDVDEYIEELLQTENDISTKRNAFLLLFNANQEKALEYINKNIISENAEDIGDIIQLVVLELLRKTCKFDPSQKSKLMKAIFYFSNSKCTSVLFECANTLTQISTAPTAVKLAVNIYVQLVSGNSDNNVKLIVLDKLHNIRQINAKLLEEQLVDITKVLQNQDIDIRKKTLDLAKSLLNSKNVITFFPILKKELKAVCFSNEPAEVEYRSLLLVTLQYCIDNFQDIAEDAVGVICESLLSQPKLDEGSTKVIADILSNSMERYPNLQQNIVKMCLKRFSDIKSQQILKVILWSIGEYIEGEETIQEVLGIIKREIGSLPFEIEKKTETTAQTEEKKPQVRTRTIILADGSYGTEVVSEAEAKKSAAEETRASYLRENLLSSSFFAASVVVTLLKLLYRIRGESQTYNLHASQILMILIGLMRFYNAEEGKTDPELINKLTIGIKLLTNPKVFFSKKFAWLERETSNEAVAKKKKLVINKIEPESVSQEAQMARQPDDLIVIRQLKGKTALNDIDLADEEINDILLSTAFDTKNEEFTSKLKKIVQLTGYSDPIYAEAIVDIHKYDISFEILLINRTKKTLQNVTVEFSTQGDLRVVDKPQQVTLGPNQSTSLKTGLKLVSSEAGLIFASINFENTAGISQGYLITNEIQIDLVDFIYPHEIQIEEFRQLWSKYEWENKIIVNSPHENPADFVRMVAKELKMYAIGDISKLEDAAFASVNLYARTKLDDDFLVNVSLEKSQGRLVGFIRVRGKTKGIIVLLGEKLKQIQAKK